MTGSPPVKPRARFGGPRYAADGRGSSRFRAGLEHLEDRLTPAGNIAITTALVVDGTGHPLSTINVGEYVSIQADFTTQDLPGDASYVVGYTVNGLTQESGPLTWGAGSSGTSSFVRLLGRFRGHARDEPGHGHRRSRPLRGGNDLRRQHHELHLQCGVARGGELSYTVAQISAAYGLNSVPSFGLPGGRWFGTNHCPR